MASEEETARRQAVVRVLQGEPAGKVAADFGRTDRWVRKWVARYDPADEGWALDRARAPVTVANRIPSETERVVLEIRDRLMANPWAQAGSGAIAWEMTRLGLEPPQSRTIERILARAKVTKRRARPERYVPKGTPYPAGPVLLGPNAWQEVDLVGPRVSGGGACLLRPQRRRRWPQEGCDRDPGLEGREADRLGAGGHLEPAGHPRRNQA